MFGLPLGSQQAGGRWRRPCQPKGRLRAEGRHHPGNKGLPDARQEAALRTEGLGEGARGQAHASTTRPRQSAAQQQEEQEGPQAAVRLGRHY